MYYPVSTGPYEGGDTALFTVSGPGGEYLGFVSYAKVWDADSRDVARGLPVAGSKCSMYTGK